jgi:hypothetical protein
VENSYVSVDESRRRDKLTRSIHRGRFIVVAVLFFVLGCSLIAIVWPTEIDDVIYFRVKMARFATDLFLAFNLLAGRKWARTVLMFLIGLGVVGLMVFIALLNKNSDPLLAIALTSLIFVSTASLWALSVSEVTNFLEHQRSGETWPEVGMSAAKYDDELDPQNGDEEENCDLEKCHWCEETITRTQYDMCPACDRPI